MKLLTEVSALWQKRHSMHFLFGKTRPSRLSQAFTHKQANPFADKPNGLFYFFSFFYLFIFFYLSAPQASFADRTISENLSWILNTQKCCSCSHFHGSRNREVSRDSVSLFLHFLLRFWTYVAANSRFACVRMSDLISSLGSPSGHLSAWGQAR